MTPADAPGPAPAGETRYEWAVFRTGGYYWVSPTVKHTGRLLGPFTKLKATEVKEALNGGR